MAVRPAMPWPHSLSSCCLSPGGPAGPAPPISVPVTAASRASVPTSTRTILWNGIAGSQRVRFRAGQVDLSRKLEVRTHIQDMWLGQAAQMLKARPAWAH